MAVYIRTSPPRDGVRGGREEFKWDSVKADQDREYFLGASVKIGMHSRGGKFEKHDWWTKRRGGVSATDLEEETKRVKDFEDSLINEALDYEFYANGDTQYQAADSIPMGCKPKHLLAGEEYKGQQEVAVPASTDQRANDAPGKKADHEQHLKRRWGKREAQGDMTSVRREKKKTNKKEKRKHKHRKRDKR